MTAFTRPLRTARARAAWSYRLSVFPIILPPVRDRPDDIQELVWFSIARHQRRMGRRVERVTRSTMNALKRYDWPGNVRELQNVVARAMILSTKDVLEVNETFSGGRRDGAGGAASCTLADAERAHIQSVLDGCDWRIDGPGAAAEKLGLNPNTLRFRMKKLGIIRPRPA